MFKCPLIRGVTGLLNLIIVTLYLAVEDVNKTNTMQA